MDTEATIKAARDVYAATHGLTYQELLTVLGTMLYTMAEDILTNCKCTTDANEKAAARQLLIGLSNSAISLIEGAGLCRGNTILAASILVRSASGIGEADVAQISDLCKSVERDMAERKARRERSN